MPQPPEGATMADEGNQLLDRDASGMATKIAEFRNNRWLGDKGPAPWRTRDVSGRIAWSTDGGRTWKDEAELDSAVGGQADGARLGADGVGWNPWAG